MEPPRRIMTRARAKAGNDVSIPSTTLIRTKRRIPEKRKALADNDSEQFMPLSSTNSVASILPNRDDLSENATLGLGAAPKRRSTRSVNSNSKCISSSHKITSKLTASKPTKKVKFLNTTLEDKENALPAKGDLSDEIQLSQSISALSVKPKRVPKSKLKQPSGSLMVPLPALSPKKARRPRRQVQDNDDDMADDLDVPTSPGLSIKPRRPMRPLSPSKDISQGADLLKGHTSLKTSVLFGSPARRIGTSPMKIPPIEASSQMKKGGLSSPAWRPAGGMSRSLQSNSKSFGTVKGKGSSLKFSIAADCEDPFGEDEISTAPLSVGRKLFRNPELEAAESLPESLKFEDLLKPEEGPRIISAASEEQMNYEEFDRRVSSFLAPVPIVSTTPPSEKEYETVVDSTTIPTVPIDDDGDTSMKDEQPGSDVQLSPTPNCKSTLANKKHRSPSEGGSSFGFFGFDDEEEEQNEDAENVAPPKATAVISLADKFSGIELDRQRRKTGDRVFGQRLDISPWKCSNTDRIANKMHIDPALLTQEIVEDEDEIVVGYSEGPVRRTVIPLKTGDDQQDNAILFCKEVTWSPANNIQSHSTDENSNRKRRSSGYAGPLSGVVAYVDVYTTDGSNVSSTFEDKLRQLGARIIKQWNWNPTAGTSISKAGITHVIFKDGSARTLQKVKDTKGAVICVGLAWIVACSESNQWVPESQFSYDLDDVPRGGRRRRKSMEPTAAREFMRSTSPTVPPRTPEKTALSRFPSTEPIKQRDSPTHMTPLMKEKVMLARRKSMLFAPKVGSPLARIPWNAH